MSSKAFEECLYSNDKAVVDLALQYISERIISQDPKVLQDLVSLAQPHAEKIDALTNQRRGSTNKVLEQIQEKLMEQPSQPGHAKLKLAEQDLDKTLAMFLQQEAEQAHLPAMITPEDLKDAIEATRLSAAGQASIASMVKSAILESELNTQRTTQALLMLETKEGGAVHPSTELPTDIETQDAMIVKNLLENTGR
jgi:hypothetical protein